MGKKANQGTAMTERAIRVLTRAPEFAAIDAEMRRRTEPMVRGMAKSPPLRRQAIKWFDTSAESYLGLVTDQASWDSYRVWLYHLLYPYARVSLFGGEAVPVSGTAVQLERKLESRLRYWHQRASEALANRREEQKLKDQTSAKTVQASAATGVDSADFQAKSWQEVEFLFFNEHRVQLTVGQTTVRRDYGELGMGDKRTGKPTLAWHILHSLATGEGVIKQSEGKHRNWSTVEKHVQELRALLRKLFSLSSDPVPFVKSIGYRAQFKISLAASYQR